MTKGYPYFLLAGAILLGSTAYVGSQTFPGIIGGGTVIGNPGASGSLPAPTTAPTLGIPGSSAGSLGLSGSSSGKVTIQPGNIAAGTYNYNLPTSAGTAGQPLLSGGGGSAQQTYGTLGVGAGGTNCSSASGTCLDNISGFASNGVVARTGAGAYSQYTDTQLTTHVQPFTSGLSGAVSASGGGVSNFLRADASWAPPPSGTVTLLNTLNPSGVSSVSDTTSLTSTYSFYLIDIQGLLFSAASANLNIQVHSGGVFVNANYNERTSVLGATYTTTSNNVAGAIQILNGDTTALNAATYTLSGQISVHNPSDTLHTKMWHGTASSVSNATGFVTNIIFGGYWAASAAAIDGFQLSMSTGTMTGTIKIYGYN